MIPDEVPIFTKDDLLPMGSEVYEVKDKATTVGWLKQLFLYGTSEKMSITPADQKDYKMAVDAFKKANGIGGRILLDDWEETTTVAKQVKALNKCMKELDYHG